MSTVYVKLLNLAVSDVVTIQLAAVVTHVIGAAAAAATTTTTTTTPTTTIVKSSDRDANFEEADDDDEDFEGDDDDEDDGDYEDDDDGSDVRFVKRKPASRHILTFHNLTKPPAFFHKASRQVPCPRLFISGPRNLNVTSLIASTTATAAAADIIIESKNQVAPEPAVHASRKRHLDTYSPAVAASKASQFDSSGW
jgi:hypothetical protein